MFFVLGCMAVRRRREERCTIRKRSHETMIIADKLFLRNCFVRHINKEGQVYSLGAASTQMQDRQAMIGARAAPVVSPATARGVRRLGAEIYGWTQSRCFRPAPVPGPRNLLSFCRSFAYYYNPRSLLMYCAALRISGRDRAPGKTPWW